MPKVQIDSPAPEISLDDFLGRKISLREFRGKNVILVFNRGFL
jgi:peroxiredoxin